MLLPKGFLADALHLRRLASANFGVFSELG